MWHLAHCSWKTSLPRAASPPLRTTGDSSSMTFWRSASGRPPPRASRRPARSARALSGWAASACCWSSDSSVSRTWPASIPSSSAVVQSARPSSARTATGRTPGVSAGSRSTRTAPAPGASPWPMASTIPAASIGDVRGEIRSSSATAASTSLRRSSINCRAASTRSNSGLDSSLAVARKFAAISGVCSASASLPQRPARLTS